MVASSIGGQGGIASVPWYKPEDPGFVNNNMAIAPVFSIIKAGWNDFYANWGEANGRTYNWLGGNVGQSGAAGDVTVQLTNASVSGNGQFLVGVSASSVGGAIELYPGLAIGDWYQWTQRDWGVRSLGYFLVRDDNTPWLTMPGNAGDVSVTLDNASIDFSGQNLVGVIAISGASPTPLPFNFKNFTGNYPKSGDVSVTISANSSISLSDSLATGPNGGFSAGVMAVSAGESTITPFGSDYYIEDVLIPMPPGVGDGGKVTVVNSGQIVVSGRNAAGIIALSAANQGGVGAAGERTSMGMPNQGRSPDAVTFTNRGVVRVAGEHVVGVYAASNGSGGLLHSLASKTSSDSASNFVIGAGGEVTLSWNQRVSCDSLTENGCDSDKVEPQSGTWTPNASMNGGDVTVNNQAGAAILAGAADRSSKVAYGVVAQSIGAGGGMVMGGAAGVLGVKDGPSGGNGGSIWVTNAGYIRTIGDSAVGVLAQSIGGGGGAGANSDSWFVAIGGRGGNGGTGGSINLNFEQGSSVVTIGDYAAGVIAHSIGGGGGHGGAAKSTGIFVDTAIGGVGGSGGDGGNIGIVSQGKTFWTAGQHSHGLVLQSIGGGGGLGGAATAKSVAIGLGTLVPELAEVPSIAVSFSLGGTGGGGGNGGAIEYWHVGNVSTYGDGSHGLLAHSIGGGGGTGGDSTAASSTLGVADTQINLSMGLGGSAANGGNGGDIWLQLGQSDGSVPTAIRTVGNNAMAVVAQSIGGGGGSAGVGSGFNLSVQFTPKAEDDTSENDDTLGQAGDDDDVGNMDDFKDLPDANNPEAAVNDASSTAGQADSDVANLDDLSDLDTSGVAVTSQETSLFSDAVTCLKKMLSTSSIRAGFEDCDAESPSAPNSTTVTLSIDVGKSGGGGGTGGSVELASSASILPRALA
ncbi:MAG: hypothetical protein LRY49_04130, partial [Burkholderiaceae bacterium]|nr:hypothetical protein [Burkholderiaceae bacterium]